MARYRKIDPRIWNDLKFRQLSDDGKLVFLFVLTHPHMTGLGAMRATVAGLAAELGWAVKRLEAALGRAVELGMVEVNAAAVFIGLPHFLKYNRPEGPNSVAAWPSALEFIPECAERDRLITRAREWLEAQSGLYRAAVKREVWEALGVEAPSGNPSDMASEMDPGGPSDMASPIHEQEQEQEHEQEGKRSMTTRPAKRPSPRARIKFDSEQGTIVGIEPEDRARWQSLYAGVDVDREIQRAAEWLVNNPERRRSNIAQFLSNWLQRAQDDIARRPRQSFLSATPGDRTAGNHTAVEEAKRRVRAAQGAVIDTTATATP